MVAIRPSNREVPPSGDGAFIQGAQHSRTHRGPRKDGTPRTRGCLRDAAPLCRALDHGLRLYLGHAEGKLPAAEVKLEARSGLVSRWLPNNHDVPLADRAAAAKERTRIGYRKPHVPLSSELMFTLSLLFNSLATAVICALLSGIAVFWISVSSNQEGSDAALGRAFAMIMGPLAGALLGLVVGLFGSLLLTTANLPETSGYRRRTHRGALHRKRRLCLENRRPRTHRRREAPGSRI